MTFTAFDVEALVRAFILSLGCGFVVGAIGYFVMRPRADWTQRKPVLTMGVTGIILFVALGSYYAWPSLMTVPALDGMAKAEAEEVLLHAKLVPNSRPQIVGGVQEGRVVPKSQSPNAGLLVRTGTVVSFGVSVASGTPPSSGSPSGGPTAAFFEPKSGETLYCARGGDALFRCDVRGSSAGLSAGGFAMLLWVKPVNPPSEQPGWYLERPPGNGIVRVDSKGSWWGVAQLGNGLYSPHEGDSVGLAVSVADDTTVDKLMAEPGVVVRDYPVGVNTDIASGVVITLKPASR